MKLKDSEIKEILIKGNYITKDDALLADKRATSQQSGIVDQLMAIGSITPDLFGQAVAEYYKVPYADLNTHVPSKEQVLTIPEAKAKKYRCVLFEDGKKSVTITTDEPDQKGLAAALKPEFKGKKIKVAFSLPEDIRDAFIHYRKALDTRFSKIIAKQKRVAPELIEEIVADAIAYRASDIHFEPQEHEVLIRFRIDGIMQEAGHISKDYYETILNRIKVQAHLRTDEHFSAQDGAIRFMNKEGKKVDMRISIAPIVDGEKIVIRLLAEYVRSFSLTDLGLSTHDQELFLEASRKPFGMIMVTGPTGSGKSTTLYGLLKHVNKPEVNIATIEDPVEYKIPGVNHIQVNTQTNLTFAKGLRSIVRQDPDVILVGEVRDMETAEISVNAALTGHLLLSTFHANDSVTAVPRMLDMGVEPFLLASTLELLVAQRLVRRICENCRTSEKLSQAQVKKIAPKAAKHFGKSTTVYVGKGCNVCNHTGFHGRTAVFELISVSNDMQDLIMKRPSAQDLWNLAKKEGAHSMFEDGVEKVKAGITTLEELVRVVPPN